LGEGKASYCELVISTRTIELIDDGGAFSHSDLLNVLNPRGGAQALKIYSVPNTTLLITYLRRDGKNITSILPPNRANSVLKGHDCRIEPQTLGLPIIQEIEAFIRGNPNCGTIFVHPKFLGFSDIPLYAAALNSNVGANRKITFILEPHSLDLTRALETALPNVNFVKM